MTPNAVDVIAILPEVIDATGSKVGPRNTIRGCEDGPGLRMEGLIARI